MSSTVCVVSGVYSKTDAKDILIWCIDKVTGKKILLGTGRSVGNGGDYVPPGVTKGQFRVTLILPGEYSTDDIHVTDDKGDSEFFSGVTIVTPGTVPVGFSADATVTFDNISAGTYGSVVK
jgi:hypothetical protein